MGKGFTLQNTEGRDLADMFYEAFDRNNLNVKVTTISNDTVGVLVTYDYTNPATRIVSNAAYPGKVSAIAKVNNDIRRKYPEGTEMLINSKITIFGNEEYLPLTKYDLILDDSRNKPKFQLHVKMLSGAYMGELTRLIAIDFINDGFLFEGHVPEGFGGPWALPTMYMSDLEDDNDVDRKISLGLLSTFKCVHTATLNDIDTSNRICHIVSTRSASLAAVAVTFLIG